jgi:hypothetical protein
VPSLPEEYKRHEKVFDEEGAKHFPLKREGELDIPLMPSAPKVLDCKVYPLTREERDTLHTFLAEEQEKGYIYPGASPYTAPVFFIGKKDSDKKRIIIDYHKLNEWTIHDNRPLPNICTQLEKLQGKAIFSKMDIRWGYKNHRIKEEDQHKACYVLTLPLLFLTLPRPFTLLPTRLPILGTALLWSPTSPTLFLLIPLISFLVLPLNPLPSAPLCAVGHILPIALLSSAPDALTETTQSSSSPLGATSLMPIP